MKAVTCVIVCLLLAPGCSVAESGVNQDQDSEVAAEAEATANAAGRAYKLAKAAESAGTDQSPETDRAEVPCSVPARAFARSFENKRNGISADQTLSEFESELAGDAYARNTAILFIQNAYGRTDQSVSQAEISRIEQVCRDFR